MEQTNVRSKPRTVPPPPRQIPLNQLWKTLPAAKQQQILKTLSRAARKASGKSLPEQEVTDECQ